MATEEQVRWFLADACDAAGTQRQWARTHGFSDAYVSDVLAGRRDISSKLAAALGYEKVVSFKRAAL